jgi:hypothetical protein
MGLKEVGCRGMDWNELVQDRGRLRGIVNAAINHPVPENSGNFWTTCKPVSFSLKALLHGVSM